MTARPERERSFHRAHAVIREFARSARSAAGEDPEALVTLLRHTLPAHFAYEERPGGFFERLEQHGTSVLLLDRLRSDHREFLDRLDRLELALAQGEDVSAELASIAERLREHEWIESLSAVQVGMHAPADPATDSGLGRALPEEVAPLLDALVNHVHGLAAGSRHELLSGVTVDVPDTLPLEIVRAVLEDTLSQRGLDFVEVVCRPREHAGVELVDARFHRVL